MKETSKLYIHLGATRRSQRGIVARRTLARLEKWELSQFEASMPNLLSGIKVSDHGTTYYI